MTGRICVVTGAGSGIGAAVAESLRGNGDTVFDVDLAGSEVAADLSRPKGRRRVVEEVRCRSDVVDVVVACAGMAKPEPATLSVNYFGVVELLTGLLPAIQRSNYPRVVVLGSVAAVHPTLDSLVDACLGDAEDVALAQAHRAIEGGKGIGIYAASKQAVTRWVRQTASTGPWAGHGITLNAVCPGVVLTPMMSDEWADPDRRRTLSQQVPMPLTSEPIGLDQIVRAIDFLADPGNRAITGQVLYVDGGADVQLRGDRHW